MKVLWKKSGHVEVAGKSLEYACQGPPPAESPTIVLLHEGLGSTSLWRDFPLQLAQATGYGVFVFSRSGYGQSDLAELPRPLDYMTREAVDVLPVLLDAIGLQRGVLIGHSDGATIAAIYSGSIADYRLRGIVLMAPHFFTEQKALDAIAATRIEFDRGGLRERMQKYHRDPENTFYGWNDSWLHPDFKNWNVTDVIDYIRVPVLAIQGQEDQYGTLAQITELESRCYAPVDTLILEQCRHSPFIDQESTVLQGITTFCERIENMEAATHGGSSS